MIAVIEAVKYSNVSFYSDLDTGRVVCVNDVIKSL